MNKIKKTPSYKALILLMFSIISLSSFAQMNIRGLVVDNKKEPLIGVTVRVQGTDNATTTNIDGIFTLSNVPNNAILDLSYVGMTPQQVPVNSQSFINVTMEEESKLLSEVVVVGYGTQMKKDITGSVSSISSKDLDNKAHSQFGYSIEGKAAGVQVIRSSGQPQSGFTMRIRGTSTITSGSDPLYIVDGVATTNTNDINPADIESISVLKDASSAAIYGTGGSNGVVIITTKRGRNHALKISFNASGTVSQAWKKMKMLDGNQFKELATEMGVTTDWNKYNANINWQDEIFRNAITQNYQISATGGSKSTTYYVSGSYINQNGIVLNNNLQRATLKTNLDHQLTKFLKIGTSLSFDTWTDIDVSENNRNGVIARLYTAIPNTGIRNPDNPAEYARSPFINDLENPVSTVYEPVHDYKSKRFHGNVYAEAEVVKDLKIKSLFGFERTNGKYTSFQDSIQTRYGKSQKGIASENTYNYKYWISENTVNYNKTISDHTFSLLGGFLIERGINDNIYKSSHDFTGAKDNNVNSGNVKSPPYPDYAQKSKISFIGRLNYSYQDKYLFTSNIRSDGSGQFSPSKRWAFTPSFSVGWRLSNEDFFKNAVKSVDDLKFRVGWGVFGNDRARPYAWYGLVDTLSNYIIGDKMQTTYNVSTLENKNLTWETTSQTDIGVDLSILKNRVTITADYYYKKTVDLLLEVPVPTSTGFTTALQNAGSMENRGFEFTLGTKNIVTDDFKWSSDFNIYTNKGKVLSIVGTTIQTGTINPAGSSYNTSIVKEGYPLGSFYGKISQGVDPATGNIVFMKDASGSADSIGIIGNANPKFVYGFSNSFTFKNVTLDIFFQGVHGNQILNATRILTESMALPMNQAATVLNRWRKPGDVTNMPGISPSSWDNSAVSSRYLEDGSYLRLKSMTLGYNLPETFISKMKMSRCLVYFTAQNLLTFTKYSGFDPEVSAFSGKNQDTTNQNTAPGVDFGTYPQSRDFVVGINISF